MTPPRKDPENPTRVDVMTAIALLQQALENLTTDVADYRKEGNDRAAAIASLAVRVSAMENEDLRRVAAAKASWKVITVGISVLGALLTAVYTVGSLTSDLIKHWFTP